MKETILLITSLFLGSGVALAQYDDDIYYNPNKAADNKKESTQIVADGRNYNPNLGETAVLTDADIDAYNGYRVYYPTPIDTIGSAVANSDDFVYTQKIQKFYNPTIVTNNSAVLAEVLENSYGNVSVVYQGGTPWLTSWVSPWYSSWYDPWYGYNVWNVPGYYYTSSWYWNNWYWGPSWTWGYNPWYWDSPWIYPGFGWAWTSPSHHNWYNHHRNPGAGRPTAYHHYNTGLGRGGNAFTGRTTNYRRPSGISNVNSSIRPVGTLSDMNSHRGNSSVTSVRPNTVITNATTSSHRGSGLDNAGSIRVNPNNSAISSTSRNNNMSVTTRNNNNTTNYRNTNTTRENNSYRNSNVNSNRNSGNATYRNSGSSRGGFGGGSGSRMGGGGSRGGGGHRR